MQRAWWKILQQRLICPLGDHKHNVVTSCVQRLEASFISSRWFSSARAFPFQFYLLQTGWDHENCRELAGAAWRAKLRAYWAKRQDRQDTIKYKQVEFVGWVLHIPQFSPTLQPPMANSLFSSLTIQPCDLKKLKQLSRCRSHLIWWSMTPWANRNFNLWTAGHWSGSWIWSTSFLKCSIYIRISFIIHLYIYKRCIYILYISHQKDVFSSVSTCPGFTQMELAFHT